jgi:hypothetical protein
MTPTPPPLGPRRSYADGRDEMNLADFPISVLQRQQPGDGEGRKLDRLELTASRYDPVKRQRVRQKVTLTTTAQDGLPTPADEHVILALLYVAKHDDNFAGDTVRFAPSQLFDVMGWAPNGRSYARLRDVLRRLKSLTIRYENAWWAAAGRAYEEEVATGIVSGYKIARQVSGPRSPKTVPSSWVTWTQQFHASLQAGNLKRLDLDVFFRLSSPTAQRLYRFLDKRFYNSPTVSLDLVELACGHVGLTEVDNVAILKRRLAPAVAELERIGFLAPLPPEGRYEKVKVGVWRVHFRSAKAAAVPAEPAALETAVEVRRPLPPAREARAAEGPAAALAAAFYRQWGATTTARPGARDVELAEGVLKQHGADAAVVVELLVNVTRRQWPECRSFSGAVQKYLADAERLLLARKRREAQREQAEARRLQEQRRQAAAGDEERRLLERWQALPAAEQEAIRQRVRAGLPAQAPEAFVRRLCLEELRRGGAG